MRTAIITYLPWLVVAFLTWTATRMSWRELAFVALMVVAVDGLKPQPAYTLPQPFLRTFGEVDAPEAFLRF